MRRALLAAALFSAVASAGNAQPASQPAITVGNVWARASAGPATTGAAYFTITSNATPDHLTGVSTPVAGMAELHESRNENGVMRMRAVHDLALEPGKPVALVPGGYHVMLMQLKHPLKAGDSFPLTLTFEKAQPVTVQVAVGTAGATAPMTDMNGGHSMGESKP